LDAPGFRETAALMPSESTVQWYPGHMVRAVRRLAEDLRLIDVVIEVVDARVPQTGRNPRLAQLAGRHARLLVLSRKDLASPDATARRLACLRENNEQAIALNATSSTSFTQLRKTVAELVGKLPSARAIVLGIPNAGKSTIINGLAGRAVARTEDRAGVTRCTQWFRMPGEKKVEIMDTAGILMPKIDTAQAQWKLALIGAVPRARFDAEEIVARFTQWAGQTGIEHIPDLETFAQTRGFLQRKPEISLHNAAWSYIKDFNEGRFGRITLDKEPPP
jgi:ribosome biogenesis GTPase A